MHHGDIFLDITELFEVPLRTGIQRVERELIRHWPGPARLVLCAYDRAANRLQVLPDAAASILIMQPEVSRLAVAEERAALHELLDNVEPTYVPLDAGPIVNPELFLNPDRARFYRELVHEGRTDVFWLVYDFLPYLEPDWFEQGTSGHAMPYVWALRSIPQVAFISEHTRQDYLHRVMRSTDRDGPVIVLGGDGLGLEAQHFGSQRDCYVALGSIEPRKRIAAALEAFALLWSEGSQARLTVIGRLLPHAKHEIALLKALEGQELLTHLPDASDAAVRDALRHARALVFASEGEGFGLPPFEALYCGIPVIVGPGVPSIEMLRADGQIRLDHISAEGIAEAVRGLQDDGRATQLWEGVGRLVIPTWRDFAAAMARWVQER